MLLSKPYNTPQAILDELEQKRIQITLTFEAITGTMIEIGQFTKAINPKDME